jgi:hypothetical protein
MQGFLIFCRLLRKRVFLQWVPVSRQLVSGLMALLVIVAGSVRAADDGPKTVAVDGLEILAQPELFSPLTEPPCSYCVDQNTKGLVKPDDRVLAWIRGAHNGGAFPLRHFISGPRVVNDTYGLFFYDPDGGYVTSFKKDYGYSFYGWRGGVMVVKGPDGTLWSALSGRAVSGPKKGQKLERVPSFLTTWNHWLMLHPESTAYDLFDGQRYQTVALPDSISPQALQSIGEVDSRLDRFAPIIGVETESHQLAFPLDESMERACYQAEVGGQSVAAFWYGPTRSAVAFNASLDGRLLHFSADSISPRTAPFKDRETGSRWTLAGRAVDGPLRGRELTWMPSVHCRWFAWSLEYPETTVFSADEDK